MTRQKLSPQELQRYTQHLKLAELGLEGQETLKNAKVLCVGLGGLGSSLLLYLTAAGIGRLGLVDADSVELGNLQRQVLYRETQVASLKTKAATEQLLALNPNVELSSYPDRLNAANAVALISDYDIVADCSDNFYTNYLLHDICFKLKKPYAYASATHFQGHCSLFSSQQGPCLRCLFPNPPDPSLLPNCDTGGVLGVLPGLLGTIQATEIIKSLLKIGQTLEKRLLMVDLLKMSFKEIHLSQNPDCELCALQKPLEALRYPIQTCVPEHGISKDSLLEHLQQDKVSLIDVRTPKEYAAYNIGGRLIPLDELPCRLQELNLDHNFILCCQSGRRSILAMNILREAGFSSVKYLIGGIGAKNNITAP